MSYLTLPYITLPYLTLPYLTLPYLTLSTLDYMHSGWLVSGLSTTVFDDFKRLHAYVVISLKASNQPFQSYGFAAQ